MKIVHVIPKFSITSGATVIGGAASSLFNLAKEQSVLNPVTILSYFPTLGNGVLPSIQGINFRKKHMYSRPNSRAYGTEFVLRMLLESNGSGKEDQIIHGHSGHADYILSTVALAKSRKLPKVYTLYCPIVPKSHVTGFPGRTKILSSFTNQIDRYIAISTNVANSIVNFGIPENRVHIIPPAVDIKKYYPVAADPEIKRKLGLTNFSPIFLFVGSAAPAKNLESLLLAFGQVINKIPHAALMITTELRLTHFQARAEMLEKLIIDLNLRDHIIQLGVIDNMQQVMAASDILVAPFRSTDGPSDYFLAALEAMAVGRPVIVSSVGGMPEVVDDKVGLFVSPDDVDQIADNMVELATATEARASMGIAAAKRIVERFNPIKIANEVYKVYQEI